MTHQDTETKNHFLKRTRNP